MNDQNRLESSFEKAKFNLAKNLALLSTVLLLTIGLIYFFENDLSAYLVITGGILSFIAYLVVIRKKEYRVPTILCLVLLSGLNILNLSLASNFHHIGDFFWAICVVTSGFFLLGKNWGIGLMIGNLLIVFGVFYLIRTNLLVQIPRPFTPFSQINFFINLCVGGTLYSFLIIEFLKQNRNIARKYIRANEELKDLNEEKTVMLREIHHRVKNNLQIVTSLLRLQTIEIKDPNVVDEFTEAIDRISAIAKIHEKMYDNKSLNQIDLSDYLEDLISDLIDSYTVEQKIETKITTNINSIPPKHLVPIALIFNELVTNSIKHAFKNHKDSTIIINAFVAEENQVTLTFADNGSWASPVGIKKSIGLELIDSFVDQLDGTCEVDKSNGTKYTIIFTI